MRNMHRYMAQAMVMLTFMHMMRVFYTGAYKPPREFNWVVGVLLLVLTLLLSFTGYLLPWDQLAFWAITVGTNMIGSAPVFGAHSRFLLIGGFQVDQNALIRFYTLHVIGLPLLAAVFMAVHFWRIRRDGGLARPL
jgi:cytochrome b6